MGHKVEVTKEKAWKLQKSTEGLFWTRRKPKETGFYWIKGKGKLDVAYVFRAPRLGQVKSFLMVSFAKDIASEELKWYVGYKWAGPIPEPEEEKDD